MPPRKAVRPPSPSTPPQLPSLVSSVTPLSSPTSSAALPPLASSPPLHVLVASFNIATRVPNTPTTGTPQLLTWLSPPADPQVSPDIVAVGFQELISQSSGALLPLGGSCHGAADPDTKRAAGRLDLLNPWIELVLHDLDAKYGSDDNENGLAYYEPVHVTRMLALGLLVFVRRADSARATVHELWEGDIGTGLLGKYPNKGCVAVGLDVDMADPANADAPPRRTSVLFANSHLGPHEGYDFYTWRNEEIQHIFESLTLQSTRGTSVRALDDFAALFYFGDLNYRLVGAGTPDALARDQFRNTVLGHVDNARHGEILAMDELNHLRETLRFRPLTGWLEPEITFLPSYKYKIADGPAGAIPEAEKLLQRAEHAFARNRVPAYCDRIMYRAVDFARPEHGDVSPDRPRALGWSAPTPGADADSLISVPPANHKNGSEKSSDDGEYEDDQQQDQQQQPASAAWTAARAHTAARITPLSYACAHAVTWSDHKPVSALFALDVAQLSTPPATDRVMTAAQQDALIDWARARQSARFWDATLANLVVRCGLAVVVGLASAALLMGGAWASSWGVPAAGRARR